MTRYVYNIFFIVFILCQSLELATGASVPAALQQDYTTGVNSLTELSYEGIGYDVAVDESGNVYVTGTSNAQWGSPVNLYSGGAGDCFVAKLTKTGVLRWNTFLGGARNDGCHAIALDEKGNVYVTGESGSTWSVPLRVFGGGSSDGFVAKLDTEGVLQWNTFLGGNLYDGGNALAVDKNGNVYVAGNSVDTWYSPINPHSGTDHDGFVAKLDKNGVLQWNTFYGGDGYDGGDRIALDNYGNVYVAGESFSEWGMPVHKFVQGDFDNYDAFVAKLDQNGVLQWNTFMGGIGSDYSRGVAIDLKGYIYVTGSSNISWGTPLAPHNGDYDAFVAQLNEKGVLQWNTFLGGKGVDYSRGITINWTDNIFLIGQSSSSWGMPINAFTDKNDAFAVKLNNNGFVEWNTFQGGPYSDFGRGITMDEIGNIYLTGESSASWGTPVNNFNGKISAFAAKLNNAGVLRWNTFIGSK
ncbi:MAG: SBBP repeat-containing protein [Desulfobulbaceae bacterium]|nr:SBBP repeat-containing protein [Desulfobulbaceae bacterium]